MEITIKLTYNELLYNNECKITTKYISLRKREFILSYINNFHTRKFNIWFSCLSQTRGVNVLHKIMLHQLLEILYLCCSSADFFSWWPSELQYCNISVVCQRSRAIMFLQNVGTWSRCYISTSQNTIIYIYTTTKLFFPTTEEFL